MSKLRFILTGLLALFLAACSGTSGPGPGPKPIPGTLPDELVGEWFTGTISSIQFYNPATGQWADPNGEGFYLILKADGTYEEGAVINSTQYNCTIRLLGRAVGTAEVSGNTLTLHQQHRKVRVINTCSGIGDNEEGAKDYVYSYELKRDANGNYGLFLNLSDGSPYGTFYPWGDGPGPGPKPLTFSGTVHAPVGGDVSGTIVYACYVVGDTCDEAKSVSGGIPERGSSASFKLEGLEAAPYQLVAFKDVDGDGDFFGRGDYYAELAEAVTPPQEGLELRLETIGGGDPEELTLSGTVYAPPGGNASGTLIYACYLVGEDCDEAKSASLQIGTGGTSAPFRLEGLEAAPYYLVALQDLTGNGEFFDDGDAYAELSDLVTPPQEGLELRLAIIGDPGPGPEPELVISGTLHAPAGGNVQGAVVFACVLADGGCDEAKSRAFEITDAGTQAAFLFEELEALGYYLFALSDVNGDSELGAGDYLVEYGEVSPPAEGIDLQLEVIE